jgi:hypothetical protein
MGWGDMQISAQFRGVVALPQVFFLALVAQHAMFAGLDG